MRTIVLLGLVACGGCFIGAEPPEIRGGMAFRVSSSIPEDSDIEQGVTSEMTAFVQHHKMFATEYSVGRGNYDVEGFTSTLNTNNFRVTGLFSTILEKQFLIQAGAGFGFIDPQYRFGTDELTDITLVANIWQTSAEFDPAFEFHIQASAEFRHAMGFRLGAFLRYSTANSDATFTFNDAFFNRFTLDGDADVGSIDIGISIGAVF